MYPNHYAMKKNRAKVFEDCDNKCALCGNKAQIVHHIDGSRANHRIENLLPLCAKCHKKFHPRIEKISLKKALLSKLNQNKWAVITNRGWRVISDTGRIYTFNNKDALLKFCEEENVELVEFTKLAEW